MVKFASPRSTPRLATASWARTRTRASGPTALATIHSRLPVLDSPTPTSVKLEPPSLEYATSTVVTATLSVAVQLMRRVEPTTQASPPFGAVTATAGRVVSAKLAEMVCATITLVNV